MELKNKQFEKILQNPIWIQKTQTKNLKIPLFLKSFIFTLSLPKFKNLKEKQRKVLKILLICKMEIKISQNWKKKKVEICKKQAIYKFSDFFRLFPNKLEKNQNKKEKIGKLNTKPSLNKQKQP